MHAHKFNCITLLFKIKKEKLQLITLTLQLANGSHQLENPVFRYIMLCLWAAVICVNM